MATSYVCSLLLTNALFDKVHRVHYAMILRVSNRKWLVDMLAAFEPLLMVLLDTIDISFHCTSGKKTYIALLPCMRLLNNAIYIELTACVMIFICFAPAVI